MNAAQVIPFPQHQFKETRAVMTNYTQMPNQLIDDYIMATVSDKAFKCLMFIVRQTIGFDRPAHPIAISQFQKYCKIKKDETVTAAIRELETLKLISVNRRKGRLSEYSLTLHNHHQTVVPPSNGSTPNKGGECTPDEQGGSTPNKGGTIKDNSKDNIKDSEEDKSAQQEALFVAQNRSLNFVQYHTADRQAISLPELAKKYPVQIDFQEQAKVSFPNHSPERIFEELKKLVQWSLSASNHMPQKWMSIWLNWMQKVPTDTELEKQQARKAKTTAKPKTERNVNQAWGNEQTYAPANDIDTGDML